MWNEANHQQLSDREKGELRADLLEAFAGRFCTPREMYSEMGSHLVRYSHECNEREFNALLGSLLSEGLIAAARVNGTTWITVRSDGESQTETVRRHAENLVRIDQRGGVEEVQQNPMFSVARHTPAVEEAAAEIAAEPPVRSYRERDDYYRRELSRDDDRGLGL